jgi:hypothetical protein
MAKVEDGFIRVLPKGQSPIFAATYEPAEKPAPEVKP